MKKSLQTGNRIIDLGEGKKIVDLDRGNLYLGEGRGEVFLYPEELKWLYYNYGYKQKSLFNPKYAEDEFNPEGIGELRYDNGKLDLIDASGNSYDITKEAKDTGFDFYRYIADLGLERTGLGGGEAGEGFEPEKERFRDKHPILFKSAAIGTGFLLPIGVCLGAYYIPNNPVKDIVKNIKKNIYKTENSIQTPVIAQNNSSEIDITQTPEPSSISNQTPATTPEPTSKPSFTHSPTPTPYHKSKGGGGGYKPAPAVTPEPKPNQPPVADAGGPYKAFVNKSVQLDASNSFDPDGKIMEYLWEYGNKTKTGPKVNFTFKEPGEHEIVLKVTDDKNATATNKTKVMIFTPYINKNDWDMKLQVPICAEKKPYYSGAASTKMILDYLKNASLNQSELYEFGHAHNFNPEILDLDPQGVKEILQKYKPEKYNFGIIAEENETELIKNICHWLNYEVPGVERPNSPSTIPTFGLYDNWMVIKGASTDINPNATQHPFEVADFVVNGFWVNDPGVKGLGNNSYKTAHELVDTYLKKINSSDLWKGKYVAVCEPKEKNANISIAPYKPNEKLIIDGKNKVRIKAMSSQRDFSYEDLIPPQLKNDSSFMLAYNNSIAREPIEVDRLDGPDYYLIPFDKEGNTSLVLVVDKNQGYFKEASWVEKPEKYLPINESEAIGLVLEKIEPETIETNLQWQPGDKSQSPYLPFWKIIADNETYFVVQNGSVYGKDLKPPKSVTNLNETKVGTNYIIWEWKNPLDKDLNHTMIYLNNELLTNLSKTITKFNATNLTPDTEYKIGIKTVDKSGNINQSLVEDYARTLKLPNKAPIALFNYTPENPKVNQSIFFNASDSFDPDGEIEKYLWDFNNDNVTDAEGKKVNHSYSSPGIYEAILKVIDNQGAENKTSREINVSPNQVPIADIGGPYSGEVGKPVSFEGYAIDPDGNITRYILNFGDGSNVSRIIDPPQKHVNISELHNYTAADIYNAILKVIDENYEPGTNQTIVNITEPPVNKTWEKMNFSERKALVEEFLRVDPTPKVVGKSGQQAHYLRVNGTMAKELYDLPCDIPLCWVYSGGAVRGHGMNSVLLGTNKSNIDDWGFITNVEQEYVSTNFTDETPPPVKTEYIFNIWKNSTIYPEDNKLIAEDNQAKFNIINYGNGTRIVQILNETQDPKEYII